MLNPKLEKAIEAAGGVRVIAAHVEKWEATVYGWRKAGRVFDVQDALALQALAREGGFTVTIEELAGVGLPKQPNGTGRRRKPNWLADAKAANRRDSHGLAESASSTSAVKRAA